MPGWRNPTDTLGLKCPKCGSKNLRPVPFATTYDDAGWPTAPKERWFSCTRQDCKHQFVVTHDGYERSTQETMSIDLRGKGAPPASTDPNSGPSADDK